MRLRERPNMPTEYTDENNVDDSETPNFDVKQFIAEVESRQAIWDTRHRLYSDKQVKKECWDQLVDIFFNKENPSEEERNGYCKILQRKWKSARDCFNRECQRLKMAEKGMPTARKSPYVFYKNLSFLHKVMSKNKFINGTKNAEPTTNDTSNSTDASISSNTDTSHNATDISSISNADNSSFNYAADTSSSTEQLTVNDIYLTDEDDHTPGPSTSQRSKRRKIEVDLDDDSNLTRMLQPSIQLIEGSTRTIERDSSKTLEDSDRLFLLSLLEPLKQVPEKLRLAVRVKIMQVVQQAVMLGEDGTQ